MAANVAGQQFLGKVASRLSIFPWVKNFIKINVSCCRDKCVFVFYADIPDGCQKWRETFLGGILASRLYRYPWGQKFCCNHSISKINAFLHFMQKLKMATKKLPFDSADTLWVKNFIKTVLLAPFLSC